MSNVAPKNITPQYLIDQGINPNGMLFGQHFLPYNPQLKQYSRDLRKGYQISEVKLWKSLKAKGMGYSFRRQYPILNYIADFYCKELKLVVEIDGYSHDSIEAQEKDEERDRQMRTLGLKVVRVTDREVRINTEAVVRWIIECGEKEDEENKLPPAPLLEGEARSDDKKIQKIIKSD